MVTPLSSAAMRTILPIGLVALAALPAQEASPVEYGAVPWLRDFAAAEAQAKASQQPLLVLFQEVPG